MLKNSDTIIRQRFTECLLMLNYIETLSPQPIPPTISATPDTIKNLRGLWLVQLYGAFEKTVNILFTDVLDEIKNSHAQINKIHPSLKSIFNYSSICSMKNCSHAMLVNKSISFLKEIESDQEVQLSSNPLGSHLQNVDGKTIVFLCSVLSIDNHQLENTTLGKLNNLKERRNAVAHGRETPAEVGERYTFQSLRDLHTLVLTEITNFHLSCSEYCKKKKFLR